MNTDREVVWELEVPNDAVDEVSALAQVHRAGESRDFVTGALVVLTLTTNSLVLVNQILKIRDTLVGRPGADKAKLRNVIGKELSVAEATEEKILDLLDNDAL